ncbi:MAG: OmpA family protein [Spongiibacteraceae bacterium]|jgi:outer membrane protein OmpA-like peptidoglycan-associated protein|nr:OmpA family protein [Spongiibacteraceae bacterium]
MTSDRLSTRAPRHAICWLVLGLCVPAPGPAAIHYQAPLDQAQWQVERNKERCLLAHQIPRYGRVVVEGAPGGQQRLYLDAVLPRLGSGTGTLIAAAPFWNPDRAELTLGTIRLNDGPRPVELDAPMTQRVLDSLADGLVPTLSGPIDEAGMTSRVSVMPVAFSQAYQSYQDCLARLPAPQPRAARAPDATRVARASGLRAAFSFPSHQSQLAPSQQAELDRIIVELKGNGALVAQIDGHGDDSQRRLLNLELSRRRADTVRDYLLAGGIPAARLQTTYHGGQQRKGRRVEIRLITRPAG